MISQMVIDRIEGNYAVCEVENVEITNPIRHTHPFDFECYMADVSLDLFRKAGVEAVEQGIYVVYHNGQNVMIICNKY